MQLPGSSCAPQGLKCDLPSSAAGAAQLTFTGAGLSYQSIPLVQVPTSRLLIYSTSSACTNSSSSKLSFSPAKNGAAGRLAKCSCLFWVPDVLMRSEQVTGIC